MTFHPTLSQYRPLINNQHLLHASEVFAAINRVNNLINYRNWQEEHSIQEERQKTIFLKSVSTELRLTLIR